MLKDKPEDRQGVDRRWFLQVTGAALAHAGLPFNGVAAAGAIAETAAPLVFSAAQKSAIVAGLQRFIHKTNIYSDNCDGGFYYDLRFELCEQLVDGQLTPGFMKKFCTEKTAQLHKIFLEFQSLLQKKCVENPSLEALLSECHAIRNQHAVELRQKVYDAFTTYLSAKKQQREREVAEAPYDPTAASYAHIVRIMKENPHLGIEYTVGNIVFKRVDLPESDITAEKRSVHLPGWGFHCDDDQRALYDHVQEVANALLAACDEDIYSHLSQAGFSEEEIPLVMKLINSNFWSNSLHRHYYANDKPHEQSTQLSIDVATNQIKKSGLSPLDYMKKYAQDISGFRTPAQRLADQARIARVEKKLEERARKHAEEWPPLGLGGGHYGILHYDRYEFS